MKKAFLSIATLLTLVTLGGCNQGTSSVAPSNSSEGTTSSEGQNSSSSSSVDVVTYSLHVETPTKTVYETNDVFEFSSIEVKLETFVNGTSKGEVLLTRDQYEVKVNNQTISGNFTFASEGSVEFVISSKEHPEATGSFTLQAVTYYSITNASSDKVVLTYLPGRALANDEVTFGLTLLPGYYFEGTLSIVDDASNPIDFVEDNYIYTFTMPAANVTISVTTDLTDFTISKDSEMIGDITLEASENGEDVFSAVAGTRLKFKAEDSVDHVFTEVYIDGVLLEKGDDDFYHFEMPHHPVKITTNKTPRYYSITSNASDLKLSTTKMYVDEVTKEEITSAYLGLRVFLSFSYDVVLVKYDIEVKDSEGNSLEVTQFEGQDTFYFDMISSDITITIKEDDWSKYYGYFVTNKVWKTWNVYSSYNGFDSKTGAEISGLNYTFNPNGRGVRGQIGFDWSVEADGTSGTILMSNIDNTSASVRKNVYYTEHLIAVKFDDTTTAKWADASFGTWDDETTVNVLRYNGTSRLVWTNDSEGHITEKFLFHNNEIFTSFHLYKDEELTQECSTEDITTTSTFYVFVDDDLTFGIEECKIVQNFNLTKTENEKYNLTLKNEAGEEITTAKNGSKVYIYGSLTSSAGDDVSIEKPIVTSGSSNVSVTKEEAIGENVWSFTMPMNDVNVALHLIDPNKFLGYSAVGRYVGYNIYDNKSSDMDFSASSNSVSSYEVTVDGKFKINGTSSDIISMDNADYGTIVASRTWAFGDGIIATPYNTSKADSYIAIKVDDGFTKDKLKTKVHWMDKGSSYAVEFLIDDQFAGGLFVTNDTYYCGVTFEYEGTDRVGAEGTYHVVYQGNTIFDVTGSTVTAHQN